MPDNVESEPTPPEGAEKPAPDEEPTGEEPEAPSLSLEQARASIEALLYASGDPISLRDFKKTLPEAGSHIRPALEELKEDYARDGRGLQLVEVAGGWQITTRPEYHECVSRLFDSPKPARLTIQALETLAVIAYRQPVTVPEIMELRGVRSAGVVRTLLERKLVKIVGRKNVVGRPLLYGTTKEFLLRFGLKSLKDLPQLKDMSEVFGDEVAEGLEVLEALDETREREETPPEASDEDASEESSEPHTAEGG